MDRIKRSISRTKQRVLQSIGKAEKTVDPEFENVRLRFLNLEKTVLALRNAIRGYCDVTAAASTASLSIGTWYSVLCKNNEEEVSISMGPEEGCIPASGRDNHKQVVSSVEKWTNAQNTFLEIVQKLNELLHKRVNVPMDDLLLLFKPYKELISRRDSVLLDHDLLARQVKRLQESSTRDPVILVSTEGQLAASYDVYCQINADVMAELTTFIDNRHHFMDHILVSLMQAQYLLYSECSPHADEFKVLANVQIETPPFMDVDVEREEEQEECEHECELNADAKAVID